MVLLATLPKWCDNAYVVMLQASLSTSNTTTSVYMRGPVDPIWYCVGYVACLDSTRCITPDFEAALVPAQAVVALCCHPSQPLIFTGCLDGAVRCWDLRTGMRTVCTKNELRICTVHIMQYGLSVRSCCSGDC